MIFTVVSCPLPTLSRRPKNASQDVPKAPQDAPQGVPGAPKSLSEMLWKHPRASSLRRPRSTQRRLQRSQELPKVSQDAPEAPKSLPRRPRSTQRHSRGSSEVPKSFHVTSQKPPEAAPEGSVRPCADETTNDTFFEATGERGHKETRDHSQTISQTKHACRPWPKRALAS